MKSEKGVTLSSLIIYVIAMSIIIGTIATITNYFYGNINGLSERTEAFKQYTEFNSYFVKEVNTRGNTVIVFHQEGTNSVDKTKIAFSNGNQFTCINNSVYYNKIKICKQTNCIFDYDEQNNKITVTMQISGKKYKNEYTIQSDI